MNIAIASLVLTSATSPQESDPTVGDIRRREVLGGMIHDYYRSESQAA